LAQPQGDPIPHPRQAGIDSAHPGLDESSDNVIANNNASDNSAFGIGVAPDTNGNTFIANTARRNAFVDLRAFDGTENLWNDNNRCNTESGAVPATVCNPGE
jgi:parallel beta-helix repeat protein